MNKYFPIKVEYEFLKNKRIWSRELKQLVSIPVTEKVTVCSVCEISMNHLHYSSKECVKHKPNCPWFSQNS